jgi:hypothetical protein
VKQAQYYRESKLQILAWRTPKPQKATAGEGCRVGVYSFAEIFASDIRATPVLGYFSPCTCVLWTWPLACGRFF